MQIQVSTRHGQLSEASQEKISAKAEKLTRIFERLTAIAVVVDLTDEATLARMWASAEALPSLPEIEEPRLWLARTV